MRLLLLLLLTSDAALVINEIEKDFSGFLGGFQGIWTEGQTGKEEFGIWKSQKEAPTTFEIYYF